MATPPSGEHPLTTALKQLEIELHGAYGRDETGRLARFTFWCAAQVATRSMAQPLHDALALCRRRTILPADVFESRGQQLLRQLPMGASLIGLKHGDPRASQMLTIASALNAAPLDAALNAARNHRLHVRFVAERRISRDANDALPPSTRPDIVDVGTGEASTSRAEPPTRSEAECARMQLEAWQRRID